MFAVGVAVVDVVAVDELWCRKMPPPSGRANVVVVVVAVVAAAVVVAVRSMVDRLQLPPW